MVEAIDQQSVAVERTDSARPHQIGQAAPAGPDAHPIEERRRHLRVVFGFEQAEKRTAHPVRDVVRAMVERGNAPDDAPPALCKEENRVGVVVEGMAAPVEDECGISIERRYPARIAAIEPVRQAYEPADASPRSRVDDLDRHHAVCHDTITRPGAGVPWSAGGASGWRSGHSNGAGRLAPCATVSLDIPTVVGFVES